MKDYLKLIPSDIFGFNLQMNLYKANNTHQCGKELFFLYKLVKCELSDDAFKCLGSFFEESILEIEVENLELAARISDLKFQMAKGDKRHFLKTAVNSYLLLYEEVEKPIFVIRAFELVKKIKNEFQEDTERFTTIFFEILFSGTSTSYLKVKVLEAFLETDLLKDNRKVVEYVKSQYDHSLELNDHRGANNYLSMLKNLDVLTGDKVKIKRAEVLMHEGDFMQSTLKPHIYNPNIPAKYKQALNEINGVRDAGDLRREIESKMIEPQQKLYESVSKFGTPIISEDNSEDLVDLSKITCFEDALKSIIAIPLVDKKTIEFNVNDEKTDLLVDTLLSYSKISNRGAVVNNQTSLEFKANLKVDSERCHIINTVLKVNNVMKSFKEPTIEEIEKLVLSYKSLFISKGREEYFVEGLYHGFKGNYLVATHILIPQIENGLKSIIRINGRGVSIQNSKEGTEEDNTLGGILECKEIDKFLGGIIDERLQDELRGFLVDKNDRNFRNDLFHGNISYQDANYYGVYAWWLVLKIIENTKKYFITPD